ncbi:hypothetical protein ACFFHM_14400 [Halalkalibacter kiskunsagensis]|uniref:Uncharacterized protein n=1 Tax=Halalkalibacter kiskunsagensis TaxID=1548599 RepID=A0ABV6KF32_9BACI
MMSVRRLALIGVGAIVLFIGIYNNQAISEEFIDRRMDEIPLSGGERDIDFLALTDFEWDQAYIFPPYTTTGEVKGKLGFSWNHRTGIEYRDDINVIVFVKDNRVKKYIELSRKYGDFNEARIEKGFTPEDATVSVVRFDQ